MVIFYSFKFFWIKRWVTLMKSVRHWGRYGQKQGSPLQKMKITHNHCFFFFFSNFNKLSHNLKFHRVHCCHVYLMVYQYVGPCGSYILKQGKHLIFKKSHNFLIYFISLPFFYYVSHHLKVHISYSCHW